MDKRFSLIHILLIGIFIININFVNSELTDLSKSLGFPENTIITSNSEGISYEKTDSGAVITFKGGDVNINGNGFSNINSQDEAKLPSLIELDKNGEIINAAFTVNEKGGNYVFGNTQVNAPPNSRVFFDKTTGIQIKVQDNSQFSEIPKAKDASIPSEYLTTIGGGDFKLPNGAIIAGELNFDKNGQSFFDLSKYAQVNYIKLEGHGNENIFFDGQKHGGDYISFGDNNLIINSDKKESPLLYFRDGNPYLKIDSGDYVTIKTQKNSEIYILNRDAQGLIPSVTAKGDYSIEEDDFNVYSSYGKIYQNSRKSSLGNELTTTSPIELLSLDANGNNLLVKDSKILIDNFNRLSSGPDTESFNSLNAEINSGTLLSGSLVSSRIAYNYPRKEDIQALTGKQIIFNEVLQGVQDRTLGRLRDYWNTLTPETQNAFNAVNVQSDNYFDSNYGWGNSKDAGAYAKHNGEIVFRENQFYFPAFKHESAHELQFAVENSATRAVDEKISSLLNLKSNYLNHHDIAVKNNDYSTADTLTGKLIEVYSELNKLTYEKSLAMTSPEVFDGQWKKIAGDVYGTSLYKSGILGQGPGNGLASPYGATNVYEDVATFVEKVVDDPCSFKNLINPGLFGNINPFSSYSPIYRQKIDLLHNNKFISDDEYNKVLQCADVK